MYTWLKKINKLDPFLVLSFIIGLIPASFLIHIIAKDFVGFYFQSISFLKFHEYAYQFIESYCENPINTGVNARAPFVPLLMSSSILLFGNNLLGVYFPFFISRVLIFPTVYLVSKHYLKQKLAFLATLLLLFIPKLQTYALSAFEADSVIALLYGLSLLFYLKSNALKKTRFVILCGLTLGFAVLSKSTGLSLTLGFLLAIVLKHIKQFKLPLIRKNLLILLGTVSVLGGPYLLWTYVSHGQIYASTHFDKSASYIFTNLPSLLLTIPYYLGINFNLGIKGLVVSILMFTFLMIGTIYSLWKKYYELIFPTLITLILIATLSSCLIGGAIPASYEFITILAFTMIVVPIVFIKGVEVTITWVWSFIFRKKIPQTILLIFLMLVVYKFINNYFTAPYTLTYIPNEYYISLKTIITKNDELPEIIFTERNGLREFKGPNVHTILKKSLNDYRFEPFGVEYKRLILGLTFISLLIVVLYKPKEKN